MLSVKNILNTEYVNLNNLFKNNHNKYLENKPFSHIVFDNFFKNEFLDNILADFPKDLKNIGIKYDNAKEKKSASISAETMSIKTNHLISYLNSYEFINFLNNLTGIKEKLIPDPYLWGAGYHELKDEGFLNVHADFNLHPELKLNRRINLLIYLNKDWQENYGGSLELWNREMKNCIKKITPIFNRVVIFNTNDFSYHGNPEKIKHPKKISRKSIALYYYSNGRPKTEINDEITQSTLFQKRPNSQDETSKKIIYKKMFGKFYIKKKIKL
jgi:hypothetical protein